ncbi:GMC oxidoreductase [Parerythrobacter aestuarii]|uniref:GMC oxidoreductase n=1 Tax=Parerythrobacter aestuarii TaxID=3020909 RepID=UPI0024DEA86B|nr:GMC family oxidoreductase [Parerythrobacter aestuarii]
MITYGENHIGGAPLKAQVCIVGTGPAGVTLAYYLAKKGVSVILLEGSRTFGRDPNSGIGPSSDYNENNQLYTGEAAGLLATSEQHFLILPSNQISTPAAGDNASERDRVYGGTSTHWGGQSRPLDAITFEKRPGFPGWPVTRAELDPYYEEACKVMGLYGPYYAPDGTAGYNFSAEFWADTLGPDYAAASVEGFDVDIYQFPQSNMLQFQSRTFDNGKTIGDSNVQVVLNASLLDIERQGGTVSALTVGVMTNNTSSDNNRTPAKQAGTFTVEADIVVLACGAVANARQLLLSGFGEDNDLIGRYLMGHPLANYGSAVSTSSSWLTPQEQKLVGWTSLYGQYGINALKGVLTPSAEAATANGVGRVWFNNDGTGNYYHELLPEYTSRVMLADSVDPVFGQKQTRVEWNLNANEQNNYETLAKMFTAAVQAKVPGQQVSVTDWANLPPTMVFNGHHIGTTRMSADPTEGVVDADLKMHGVDNLYIAGSSVWASAGISNPTFSIIAFSIRLAEHLGQKLGSA